MFAKKVSRTHLKVNRHDYVLFNVMPKKYNKTHKKSPSSCPSDLDALKLILKVKLSVKKSGHALPAL